MSEREKRILLSCIANGFEFLGDLCKISEKEFLPFGELDRLLMQAQEAFERATPARPLPGGNHEGYTCLICPNCCRVVGDENGRFAFCPDCGQAMDGRNEEKWA